MLVIQHQWKMVIETLDDKLTNDMRIINCSHLLPESLRKEQDFKKFKSLLKTFLFKTAYN